MGGGWQQRERTVKLVDAATANDVASAVVNTAGAPAGPFRYVDLAAPLTPAGRRQLLPGERGKAGGDAWYDYDTRLVTTSAAAGTGAVYAFPATPANWVRGGSPSNGFGPSSLLYR